MPLPMPQPDVLGRNGTFVGLRKYQSRVGTFNRFLREHAQTEQERELLAAKLVGRWRSGAPLTLAPDRDDPELGADPRRNNDFTYAADPDGRQVPLGSHMRRMNPRDTKLAILTDVNIHRIIRRSTTYGAPYDPDAISPQDDETPRGLYFIFISAKAMATLEFLQQEWINNGNFMSLGDERDPNVGLQEDGATFTIPQEPVRRRIHGIETFNVLRGGEYFFMPSLSALRWLADRPRKEKAHDELRLRRADHRHDGQPGSEPVIDDHGPGRTGHVAVAEQGSPRHPAASGRRLRARQPGHAAPARGARRRSRRAAPRRQAVGHHPRIPVLNRAKKK